MFKKIFIVITSFLISQSVLAHQGRLDGSGGHRVNKEWVYEGQYILIKDNQAELKEGKIIFKAGDYHYHCKPSANKIDITTYREGIYIPAIEKEVKNYLSGNINISEENRVASKESNLYHKSNCKYIKNIKEENIVIFEDKEDARNNNYTPCRVCKPEDN